MDIVMKENGSNGCPWIVIKKGGLLLPLVEKEFVWPLNP